MYAARSLAKNVMASASSSGFANRFVGTAFFIALAASSSELPVLALLFFIGAMTTKDIVDSDADKKTGIRTLINTFGTKKAALISFPFLFFPFVFIPLLITYDLLNGYLIPLTVFAVPSFLIFYLMIKESESTTLENVHAWSLMYVTYLFYAVGFSSLIVFGEAGFLTFLT